MTLSEKDIKRFWSKVDIRDANECWNWKAGKLAHGYGQFQAGGSMYLAHRIAWQLANGREPRPGFDIAHAPLICHNPSCCNSAHLSEKTKKENEADKLLDGTVARGERNGNHTHPESRPRGERNGTHTHPESVARGNRHSSRTHPERLPRGERHGSHLHPESIARGERHGNAKLTQSQVNQIREMRQRKPPVLQRIVAKLFGVSRSTISLIEHEILWGDDEAR